MSMAERIRSLPPVPEGRDPLALARTVEALHARNQLLAETLHNVCEAWKVLRGESPGSVEEILRACRVG